MGRIRHDVMKPVYRPRGGAKVPHKKFTAEQQTVVMPPPEQVFIPMQQHIGAPCKPMVRPGDKVSLGQVIGDTDKFVSAPIHASVSGTVSAITEIQMPGGNMVETVVIDSDGQMTPSPEVSPYTVETVEDLLQAAKVSGLVGLGGAGFPTHVKLKPNPDRPIDTIIINAAECEPFITADYRECMENTDMIMNGVYLLLDILKPERIIIAVEDNKPAAIEKLLAIADSDRDTEHRVHVMKLRSRYPQGAEKVLVLSATGRKIPMGKLPSDVGCAVMNVTSVAALWRFISTGMPLVTKRVTVDGPDMKQHAKNVLVPIGTPVEKVIEFAGGPDGEISKALMGGPMMGLALADGSIPVMKQTNAIIVFNKEKDIAGFKEGPCIRCGRCASACPMSLMPTLIERYAKIKDVESLTRIGVGVCMECGSCAFNCPAHRPLVQYMRLAKEIQRNGGRK